MSPEQALKRLQEAELEILLAISEVCKKTQVSWWMDSGTALGAVRHGGFIPWDDDIDIGMLRSDYDRFLEVAPRLLPEGFSLHTARDTKGFAPLFAKVFLDGTRFETQETREAGLRQGIFVDVFPYDFLYEDSSRRKAQISSAVNAQRKSYIYHAKSINVPHGGMLGACESLGCRAMHTLERLAIKNPAVLQDEFDANVPVEGGRGVSNLVLSLVWPQMEPLAVDDYLPCANASFEDYELPVPRHIEKYLTAMYSDWRKLPAPEDRHTHLPLLLDFGDGEVWVAGE